MPPSISEPAGTPEPAPNRRFLWPAEYYASETPKPVLPQWATYGCGVAALVALAVVFAGGAWLASGGFAQVLDLTFGMSLGEMRGMYAPEVTAAQKQTLEREIEALRENVRSGAVPAGSLQGVLQTMQKAMSDEKLTGTEVDAIVAEARRANRVPRPKGLRAHRLTDPRDAARVRATVRS